jgi:hypothetical protein
MIRIEIVPTKNIMISSGSIPKITEEAVFDTNPENLYAFMRKKDDAYGYIGEMRFGHAYHRICVPFYDIDKYFFHDFSRMLADHWDDAVLIISDDLKKIGAFASRKK